MIKFYVLFSLLVFSGYAQNIVTAEDAVKIGLKNNYDIQIAKNNQEIAENSSGFGTAGFLPILNATGTYNVSNSEQDTDSPFSFGDTDNRTKNAQLTLNWTLFDGFKMFIDNSRYNELAKLGTYQSRNTIENSVIGILRAYYNVVQQKQLLEVSKNSLEISRLRMEKEQVRKDLGSSSSTDFLNARVSYNNDRSSFLKQELQLLVAKKDLNLILGREPNKTFDVQEQIQVSMIELNFDELLELSNKNNKTLLISKQNKLIADKKFSLSKSVYYPRLALNANYGYTDSHTDRLGVLTSSEMSSDIESKSIDRSVGLTLNFNLFNGFRDKINYQNAKLEAKNQELSFNKSLNELNGLIHEKYTSLSQQIQITKLEEENVIAAQQNLRLLQDLFQVGAASSLEFRDAQVNLARSQANLIAAKFQAKMMRIELEQLAGMLTIE
jgi:outer membrane protein TolC